MLPEGRVDAYSNASDQEMGWQRRQAFNISLAVGIIAHWSSEIVPTRFSRRLSDEAVSSKRTLT